MINFIFNLPFCRRACRSGIVSSEISSPLSWKHIGAEFASCRPPLPSAAIILRPHPALWPASLPGTGPVQNQKVSLFNPGHCHPAANRSPPPPTTLTLLPSARTTLTPHKRHPHGRALALELLMGPLVQPYAAPHPPPPEFQCE